MWAGAFHAFLPRVAAAQGLWRPGGCQAIQALGWQGHGPTWPQRLEPWGRHLGPREPEWGTAVGWRVPGLDPAAGV